MTTEYGCYCFFTATYLADKILAVKFMVSPYSLAVLSNSGAPVNAYRIHRYNTKVQFGAFITSKAIEIT